MWPRGNPAVPGNSAPFRRRRRPLLLATISPHKQTYNTISYCIVTPSQPATMSSTSSTASSASASASAGNLSGVLRQQMASPSLYQQMVNLQQQMATLQQQMANLTAQNAQQGLGLGGAEEGSDDDNTVVRMMREEAARLDESEHLLRDHGRAARDAAIAEAVEPLRREIANLRAENAVLAEDMFRLRAQLRRQGGGETGAGRKEKKEEEKKDGEDV